MTGFRDADNDIDPEAWRTYLCDTARAYRVAMREQWTEEAPVMPREQALIDANIALKRMVDVLTCECDRLRRLVEFRAAAHAPPGPAAALHRALRGGDGIPR